jgi:hypothetical protein
MLVGKITHVLVCDRVNKDRNVINQELAQYLKAFST